jgi:hypothetical protein
MGELMDENVKFLIRVRGDRSGFGCEFLDSDKKNDAWHTLGYTPAFYKVRALKIELSTGKTEFLAANLTESEFTYE